MQSDIAPIEYGNTRHRVRTGGCFVDAGILEDDESLNHSINRRISSDGSASWERKKCKSIPTGPPMFIREQSGMSMVSDFSSEYTHVSSIKSSNNRNLDDGGPEAEKIEADKRMSLIKEDSFATVGMSEKDAGNKTSHSRRSDYDIKSISLNSGVKSISLNSVAAKSISLNSVKKQEKTNRRKKDNTSVPSDSYVRQLEVELINLKMKMAQAQSQIDEHKLQANREQMSLRVFQVALEQENMALRAENERLKCLLEEERGDCRQMVLRIKEQEVVINHLKDNAQLTSRQKSKLLRENDALQQPEVFEDYVVEERRPQRFPSFVVDKLSKSGSGLAI